MSKKEPLYDWERVERKEYHQHRREREREIREKERRSRKAAKGRLDLPFLALVTVITVIGLVMLLSASFPYSNKVYGTPYHFFTRQLLFAGLGYFAMLFIGKINYERFRAFSRLLLYVAIVLLILVVIPGVGITRNHATRWLGFGETLQFQPSEIAKMAVILYFADTISRKRERMESFREGVLPYGVILMGIGGLMMLEPHFSGTVLIFATGVIMLIIGGIRMRWVLGGGTLFGVGVWVLIGKLGYGASRLSMWLNPWQDTTDDGYQMCQSLISIGSGGLLGLGLGRSRQKYMYLPERQNDFIFAIVCEELGFIGASIIILIFIALILRGFWIALRARDRFGTLLTVGIMSLFALQTFLNIAVVTGLVPCTGISLPLFSYGGTALTLQLAEMGIVLSVSRQIKTPRGE